MDIIEIGGFIRHGAPASKYANSIKFPDFTDPAYHRQNDLCNTARRMMGDMNFDDEQHLIVAMSSQARELLKRLTDSFLHNDYKLSAKDEADLRRAVQSLQQVQQ